jgi:hypothetical protein
MHALVTSPCCVTHSMFHVPPNHRSQSCTRPIESQSLDGHWKLQRSGSAGRRHAEIPDTGRRRQGLVSRVDNERKNEDGSTSRAADNRPVLHGFSSAIAIAQGTRHLRGRATRAHSNTPISSQISQFLFFSIGDDPRKSRTPIRCTSLISATWSRKLDKSVDVRVSTRRSFKQLQPPVG